MKDTFASTAIPGPPFPPGEAVVGNIAPNTPVWHFQDDAVTGDVRISPDSTGSYLMPVVFQPQQNMLPTHYLDFADGPGPIPGTNFPSIGQFSKDLAFELEESGAIGSAWRVIKNGPRRLVAITAIAATLSLVWTPHSPYDGGARRSHNS